MKMMMGKRGVILLAILCFITSSFATFSRNGNNYWWTDDSVNLCNGSKPVMRLWVPDTTGSVVIKGVFLNDNNSGCGGDLTYWCDNAVFQKFCKQFGFGIFATANVKGDYVYSVMGARILRALSDWSTLGKHPELARVPFVAVGGSNAGCASYSMAMLVPERTICLCNALTYWAFNPRTPTDAGIKVPAMMIDGSVDNYIQLEDSVVRENRPRGALWSHMLVWGMPHTWNRVPMMYYPFMEKMINYRYPANGNPRLAPVALKPILEQDGWLTDPATWTTGYTDIAAYSQYTKDKSKADWLFDADMAFLYRGYSSNNVKLSLATPDSLPWTSASSECWNMNTYKPGDQFTLNVNADLLPGWTKIVLYRGATKVDSIAPGDLLRFKVTAPASPICQSYTLLGYDSSMKIYPANMFTVLVMGDQPTTVASRGVSSASAHSIGRGMKARVRVWDLLGREIVSPALPNGRNADRPKAGLGFSSRLNGVFVVE